MSGDPSNFRRIRYLFGADAGAVRKQFRASAWSDDQTRDCIRRLWAERGLAVDPHTAVGLLGLRAELKRRPGTTGIVLGTAHPAKFAETVEPLIGRTLPVPAGIARRLGLPPRSTTAAPSLAALRQVLMKLAAE